MLHSFVDASLMQSQSYAAARWPGAELSRLAVFRDGSPIGAAQVILHKVPLLGGGLAYVHFGPLWLTSGGSQDPENLRLVVEHLRDEYAIRRRMLLRIRPWPGRTNEDVVSPLFEQAGFSCHQDASPERFLVNVGQPAGELHKSLHGKWRYNLKRSYKHELRVEHLPREVGLGPFMDLYGHMQARKGFFDTSAIEELPEIHADLSDDMKPDVWLCYLDGEPLAGAVISVLGDTAQYLFGASTDDALRVNAGYRLHWEIAEWLSGTDARWYDLGGDSGSSGLRQFKTGMVGRSGRIVPLPGDFELSGSLSSSAAVRLALGLRESRAAVARAARRLSG